MKKTILTLSLALALIFVVGLAAGCAEATTVTETRTTTQVATVTFTPPTSPNATFTVTITQTIGTLTQTSVVALDGPAPAIPHGSEIAGMYGPCFSCHPIPAGHTGRVANEDLCGQCHVQGAIRPDLMP
jgi:hypothetical protein